MLFDIHYAVATIIRSLELQEVDLGSLHRASPVESVVVSHTYNLFSESTPQSV